ncbi:unnamed protein product [Prunus armeniaca]
MSLEIVICSSKIGSRSGQSAHPSNHHVSIVESRAVKHGVDSSSPIPLEVRLTEAKKARKSFAWAKGSSATSAADPKVDKSTLAEDVGVSDLLKMNFLSSPSTCAELVHQIRQAGDLDVEDQASGAAESVADQTDAEVAADQGSPAGCLVNCLSVSGLRHVLPKSGDVLMRVARLAYVQRRVNESDPFGLRPETCR